MPDDVKDPLRNWTRLNSMVRTCTEEECWKLIEREIASAAPRRQFVFRLHSRINKARADRERDELSDRLNKRIGIA